MGSALSQADALERELHKSLHIKLKLFKYQPIAINEALKKLSNYLRTVIEIGTYMYVFNDKNIAKSIISLEAAVDELAYQLLMHISMAVGHDVKEAWKAIPVYVYVHGVDKVMDSFKDLAMATLRGHVPSPELSRGISYLSEVSIVPIPGERIEGSTTRDLESAFSIEVLMILRNSSIILNPEREVMKRGDLVYIRGFKENLDDLCRSLEIRCLEASKPSTELTPILQDVYSMIDMLTVLTDIAHYQLKTQDPQLVEEILDLEEAFDALRIRVSKAIVASNKLSENDKLSLLQLVTRLEDVSDALTYIATMPAQDEYRDVLAEMIEGSDERMTTFFSMRDVDLEEIAKVLDDWGSKPLAIKRGSEWIAVTPYNVRKIKVLKGDRILVLYPAIFENEVVSSLKLMGLERS